MNNVTIPDSREASLVDLAWEICTASASKNAKSEGFYMPETTGLTCDLDVEAIRRARFGRNMI